MGSSSKTNLTIRTLNIIQNKPRLRSHTKSRRGCRNCKARKVKCKEDTPSCSNCTARGLTCSYLEDQREAKSLSHTPFTSLRVHGLGPQDLRFLHHLLIDGFHCVPEYAKIWEAEATELAFKCDYLMHGLLAFGAFHLACRGETTASVRGLYHRQMALEGVQKAVANCSALKKFEVAALLAACYTLVFQSIFMDDSLAEYMIAMRGGALVHRWSEEQTKGRYPTPEDTDMRKPTEAVVLWIDSEEITIDKGISDSALRSLKNIKAVLDTQLQHAMCDILLATTEAFQTSPLEGFRSIKNIDMWMLCLPQTAVDELLDPSQPACRSIYAHFLALRAVLMPAAIYEGLEKTEQPLARMVLWIENLCHNMPPEWVRLAQWPLQVLDTVKAEAARRGRWITNGNLSDAVLQRPEGFVTSFTAAKAIALRPHE